MYELTSSSVTFGACLILTGSSIFSASLGEALSETQQLSVDWRSSPSVLALAVTLTVPSSLTVTSSHDLSSGATSAPQYC